ARREEHAGGVGRLEGVSIDEHQAAAASLSGEEDGEVTRHNTAHAAEADQFHGKVWRNWGQWVLRSHGNLVTEVVTLVGFVRLRDESASSRTERSSGGLRPGQARRWALRRCAVCGSLRGRTRAG